MPPRPKPLHTGRADRPSSVGERVAPLDWPAIDTQLDEHGVATTGPLWWIAAPDQHGRLHFVHQLLA
jgi:hypothetical protein